MDKKEQLALKLSYNVIKSMFYKNKNSWCLADVVQFRTEEIKPAAAKGSAADTDDDFELTEEVVEEKRGKKIRKINLTVEDIRSALIEQILKNEAKGKPVKYIYGYAKRFVHNTIIDLIKPDKEAKERYERLQEIEDNYGAYSDEEVMEDPRPSKRRGADEIFFSLQQKKIILACLNLLPKEARTVIVRYFYYGDSVAEIAQKMKKTPEQIAQIKHKALGTMRKALESTYGEEVENIKGRLHDLSVWQEFLSTAYEKSQRQPVHIPVSSNPDTMETETMNREYIKMLQHTIYEVAKTMPISDMIDEYLWGRLEGEQRIVFEKHLLECDECFKELQERKNMTLVLKSVLKDSSMDN